MKIELKGLNNIIRSDFLSEDWIGKECLIDNQSHEVIYCIQTIEKGMLLITLELREMTELPKG